MTSSASPTEQTTVAPDRLEAARARRLAGYRGEYVGEAWSGIALGAVMLLTAIPIALHSPGPWWLAWQSPPAVTGILAVVLGTSDLRGAKRLGLAELEELHASIGHLRKALHARRPWCSGAIVASITCVGFAQLAVHREISIQAAGLVKGLTRSGDYWRLLTAETLHANLQHFFFNMVSLLGLGRAVESIASRSMAVLTFVVAALVGSLFSLILIPDQTSVGASGGIMGLAGLLLVLGRYRRNQLPGLMKGMLTMTGIIALAGALGFSFTDNACHFGGFLAGVGIAFVVVEKDVDAPQMTRGGLIVQLLGLASLALLFAACALSVTLIMRAR